MDAYRQLTVRCRRDIPELFKYNTFAIISDGVNNRYGSLKAMMQVLFRWELPLSVLKDFDFPDSSKDEWMVVCCCPLFFAAHKLFENTRLHSKLRQDGEGKSTYFGATGCGKIIAILFLLRMLMVCSQHGNRANN